MVNGRMYGLSSSWWVVRLLITGITIGWVLCQEDLGPCQEYFNFQSEKDVSALSGKWLTLGSTRRVFSCDNFTGTRKSDQVMQLDESWMLPGLLGVWKHEVTSEVTAKDTHLEVTMSGFDGALTSGRLGVGVHGKSLYLIQCSSLLWFPIVSITVLSREVSPDPESEAREIFRKFNVPSNIPSFFTVNHDGCDTLPKSAATDNSPSSQLLLVPNEATDAGSPSPNWRITHSPDRNIIF